MKLQNIFSLAYQRKKDHESLCFSLFGILRIPPFVNHIGKDVNSDWLADQWDEGSAKGHAQFHKGRMKGDDPEIDTAQTLKRLDGNLALLEKIQDFN